LIHPSLPQLFLYCLIHPPPFMVGIRRISGRMPLWFLWNIGTRVPQFYVKKFRSA
jgi:hypothetical protein